MDILQPQQNKPAQQGTGFTNLSQYLGANQNNQLGQTVSGGVQQAGQQASSAINQAGSDFQTGVQNEQSRLSQTGQNATNTLNSVMGGNNVTDSDKSNMATALSGQGQGPQGLANSDTLQNQANAATQLGQAAGSQQGRYGLLQRYVGRGQNYNLGQQGLDNMILGQTGQPQLRQARAATSGLGQQANQAIQAASAQGQQLGNQAKQLQSNVQQQIGQNVTNYDTQMGQKLATDQAAQQSLIGQLSGSGSNAPITLDQNTLNMLKTASGGALDAGTSLYNTDLSPYLAANTLYANNQGVQNAQDFSKIQNLGQLAGNSLAGTDQGNLLQQYINNKSAVGQYDANAPISVTNAGALADAINKQKSDYNSQMAQQQGIIQGDVRSLTTAAPGMNSLGANALYGQILNAQLQNAQTPEDKQAAQTAMNNYQSILNNSVGDNSDSRFTADFLKQFQTPELLAAENSGMGNVSIPGGDYLNQARAQEAAISAAQAQQDALGKQFNIMRKLQVAPPAATANPIVQGPLSAG